MDTKREWNGDVELLGKYASRLYKATWEILKDDRLYYTPVNIANTIMPEGVESYETLADAIAALG